ncbi:MAG: hypothetical protein NUV82_02890, partial [Candidatus Komeilibacteria bacterium]|nr:hypothetical protein [Candidatus Komeilibacteria bacterium]
EEEADTTSETEEIIITADDLGVRQPGSWHWLKKAARVVEKALTFNPIGKAEIELTEASEELLLAQGPSIDEEVAAVKIRRYEDKISTIREHLANSGENSVRLEKLVERLHDRQLKHQIILEELAERMPMEAEKIETIKNRIIEQRRELWAKHEDKLKSRMENMIETHADTPAWQVKIFEQLDQIKDDTSDAKPMPAVAELKNMVIEKIRPQLQDSINMGKALLLEELPGDKMRRMEIIDELKTEVNQRWRSKTEISPVVELKTRIENRVREEKEKNMRASEHWQPSTANNEDDSDVEDSEEVIETERANDEDIPSAERVNKVRKIMPPLLDRAKQENCPAVNPPHRELEEKCTAQGGQWERKFEDNCFRAWVCTTP